MLTDDEVDQIRRYTRRLYYSMRLENTGASLEESVSHALYLAVRSERDYDPTRGLTRKQYMLAVIRKRLRWLCNMQSKFFRPLKSTTIRKGSRAKRMIPSGAFLVAEACQFREDDEGHAVVDPPTEGDDDDFGELVEWAENLLEKPRWREVFRMRFVEGKTFEEIAERYAVSKECIHNQIKTVILPRLREAAKCWY